MTLKQAGQIYRSLCTLVEVRGHIWDDMPRSWRDEMRDDFEQIIAAKSERSAARIARQAWRPVPGFPATTMARCVRNKWQKIKTQMKG